MGLTFVTPQNSFVRFDSESYTHCIWGENKLCLPVYAESDIAFQFIVEADTEEEADALCLAYESGIQMGIVLDCDQEGFTSEFEELPDRYRISPLQVLYNWANGVPGMIGNVDNGECFYIRVIVGEVTGCSNCFQRVPEDCFTSVIEYGNDENFAGFNYCNSGAVDSGDSTDCDPTVVTFTNQESLSIPYTASLQAKYGPVPTVQVWVYVDGELQNVGVVATFDAMPPSFINVGLGGVSSGIVVIR
jgi:hypothetical protein